MDIKKIGFLEVYKLDDKSSVMGAILVTDPDTKPLEFRVTAPIKPTSFQKTLYGDVLLEHILVELISVPLLSAIHEELDLILVKDPFFLGANDKQGVRVVRIYGKDESPSRLNGSVEEIPSALNGHSKLFIETSKKFETEMPEIRESLLPIAEQRNLLEPFERLKLACEQVHLQKTTD
ncbi:MAG: hypothetical protein Kow0098_23230 [Ignavibacteriaceae bacterium]